MHKYFIYGLFKEDAIFYIGMTINVMQRFYKHQSYYGDDISIKILDEYYGSKDTALVLEEFWIKKYKDLGIDLYNKVKKNEHKKTYTFTTYPEVYEQAKKIALEEGTTLSEKINEMLMKYVDDEVELILK